MWPRALFEETGGWDETLKANQDGDLVMRALLLGITISFVNETSVYYRKRPNSISSQYSGETLRSRIKTLLSVERRLRYKGNFEHYRSTIAGLYHNLARYHFMFDRIAASQCNDHALRLAGRRSYRGTAGHIFWTRLLGLKRKALIGAEIDHSLRKAKKLIRRVVTTQ